MSCLLLLLLELEALGRQLKYSRRGRRASVGSTSTLGLGCFGRTHAICARLRLVEQEDAVESYIDAAKDGRMLAL